MRKAGVLITLVCLLAASNFTLADTFGTGVYQITIDFVNISGDSGNLGSWPAGSDYTFTGVNHDDYRMGKFEITNAQWYKFKTSLGVPFTGSPSSAYDGSPYYTGQDMPNNMVSWYEAAQFVNLLNTSKGYQAAYKFTGTQGTSGYTLGVWSASDAGYNADNPYRNSNAFYFLPTEAEWLKAAYWNGTNLQPWSTVGNVVPIAGINANYNNSVKQVWNVGRGSQELNGTYDMMGNVWEWMENPWYLGDYLSGSNRSIRGGSYYYYDYFIRSSFREFTNPDYESIFIGFRVASIPEPATLLLLGLGGVMLRPKK
jgi:formylglycine-generating enzyme required for sulfatase activity